MSILVTGACGFIGSNLCKWLDDIGYNVIPYDNEYLGTITNLTPRLREKFIYGSIADKQKMKYLRRYGISHIVNLAAYSSTPMFYDDPTMGIKVNVDGFRNVLNLAENEGAKVIYASTSSLYNTLNGFKEHDPVYPGSYYEYTKYCNELDASLYLRRSGVESVGLRFFSVYGYNELHKGKYANLVSQFLWAMEKGRHPVVYGNGTQTRDFIWVEDLCNVIEKLFNESFRSAILNVGTGKSHSLNVLIDIINDELGTSIVPKYVPNPVLNYVQDTKANTDKLKFMLKYIPKTTLRQGIRKLIESKTLNSMSY